MQSEKRQVSDEHFISSSPEETFEFGERIGSTLAGGEIVLLHGGLGAGKTLLTKGVLNALEFDIDEVTSPSFTLVNLYKAKFDVYHIDLWRINSGANAGEAVGLDEILENEEAVVMIEWAERLGPYRFTRKVLDVNLTGDGEEPRKITFENGQPCG